MIEYYDPNSRLKHTVRITLMQYDYVGHIAYKIGGSCHGSDLLDGSCFGEDDQEIIDNYVENDCKLSYDEDYDIYKAILTNPSGEFIEVEGDADEMQNMVVSIEFVEVEENQNDL